MSHNEKRVVFITPVITHYRLRFHELLREYLRDAGVRYDLIYGEPDEIEARKGDLVEPDWARKIPQRRIEIGGAALSYHGVQLATRGANLVILMQENKHLQNYLFQILPASLRPKLAFMGHGRNFQSRERRSLGERWKRIWATRIDWWFAYTDETRNHVASLGFPTDRITVFNNSVDTSEVRRMVDVTTPSRLEALRVGLGLSGRHVGVFVGGIYPDKRMPFLVESADAIRARLPDFELLVIGGGSDLSVIEDLARARPWIRVLGPRFGQEKIELMMLGHIFMMPGLVGLAILDAGSAGLPMATTRFPWHSPEIAYLKPGVNGLMVEDWEDPVAYANAVADVLSDPDRLAKMREAARDLGQTHTIEAMARNFADGILKALAA